jgi:hypothetical protein
LVKHDSPQHNAFSQCCQRASTSRLGAAIAQVLACVLTGAVLTITVSWALAVWLPHENLIRADNSNVLDDQRRIEEVSMGRPGMQRRWWSVYSRHDRYSGFSMFGEVFRGRIDVTKPKGRCLYLWGDMRFCAESSGTLGEGVEDARGWPWLAMSCEFSHVTTPGSGLTMRTTHGIELSPPGSDYATGRAIPLRPVWAGLLCGSCTYGTAVGLMWHGVRMMRKRVRKLRGRCVRCNYDRTGLVAGHPCPECGLTCL